MPVVTMKDLLEAGVHFGHQTNRWNPKMARMIFGERSGIYIIDLAKTARALEEAWQFVSEVVSRGQSVVFVGTKKQAQEVVQAEAERCGMPYVNQRWLGGTLTNFQTVRKTAERLRTLTEMEAQGGFEGLTKKEVARLQHEKVKLERNLKGILSLTRLPGAVFVVDTHKERIAVAEARKLGIPVVAIADTNSDPDEVDYCVPGNDDAMRSIKLITGKVADAVVEGQNRASVAADEARAAAAVKQAGEVAAAPVEVEVADLKAADEAKRVRIRRRKPHDDKGPKTGA